MDMFSGKRLRILKKVFLDEICCEVANVILANAVGKQAQLFQVAAPRYSFFAKICKDAMQIFMKFLCKIAT